jgi:antitoxin ParD1/3/4
MKMPAITKRTCRKVVRSGLAARQSRDAALERWLIDEVGPVYDAMMKAPSRGIPANKVFSTLRVRHLTRVKASRRGKK